MKPKFWECSTARRADWNADKWSITLFQSASIARVSVMGAPSLTWSTSVSGGVLPADARAFAYYVQNAAELWEKWDRDTGKPTDKVLK